ncbi:segregation/condensation protein A [Flaviflexus huanghaiensis]|uniref:segregation/condensation protein A n=1 Tax=Flaviflexus huanghaiensis TaxID=1111473 RepID=UPI0015F81E54
MKSSPAATVRKQDTLFETEGALGFDVSLDVFSGPFDVLLSLIAKRRLDITDIALAEVTDEFLAHARARAEMDLSQASEFLVVASTLLALKAARLLPTADDDDEDLELLEARDLLFAKLLQYKAYKDLAVMITRTLAENARAMARDVPLEEEFAALMPEVDLRISLDGFAELARQALERDMSAPEIELDHLHAPLVSVDSQVDVLKVKLAGGRVVSFRELCEDAPTIATVVARFLAVLDLLKDNSVTVLQDGALAELEVQWTA